MRWRTNDCGTLMLRAAIPLAVIASLVGCGMPASAPATPPPPIAATVGPAPRPSATVTSASPGLPFARLSGHWQHYVSLNQVNSLAFDAAGELWAGTSAGVVSWDLTKDTAQRHTFGDCVSPLQECDTQNWWVHDILVVQAPPGIRTVWAATASGVRRYDGSTWRTFTQADGLPDTLAFAVAAAPDGSIWAATGSGLAVFDGEHWTAHTVMADVEGGTVWAVSVTPDGTVWASTHAAGVIRYDPHEDTWQRFSTESGLLYPNARFLTTGPDGQPWVHIGYDNVYRFDGETWQLAYTAGGGQWICDIAFGAPAILDGPLGNDLPLIATCGGFHTIGAGLVYPAGGSWRAFTTSDGLPANDLAAVAIAPGGEIAVGTDRGISVYRNGSWRVLREGPTLGTVTAAAVTPDGVAWFGFGDASFRTSGGGLASFDGVRWHFGDAGGPSPDANVRAIAVAPEGDLWIGAGCALMRHQDTGWETLAGCDTMTGNVIDIEFGANGEVWVATDLSVYRVKGTAVTTYENQMAMAIAVDAEGTLWMSRNPLADGGLRSFDGSTWITRSSPVDNIRVIAIPSADEVLVAGSGRLASFDGMHWDVTAAPVPDLSLLAVHPDGTVWAAGGYTIARRTKNSWEVVTTLGAPVRALAFPPEAGVWIATDDGVLRYIP